MAAMNTDEKFYENENGVYFKSGYPSQWFITPCVDTNGVAYNCCEQWMMHSKANYFGDLETAERIMATQDPKEQKKLGREVKNFNEYAWNTIADLVVYSANFAKFSQNDELKTLLLATGTKQIVECSPYDRIWGNGLDITTTLATPEKEWKGCNRLGKAIMRVRNNLASGM